MTSGEPVVAQQLELRLVGVGVVVVHDRDGLFLEHATRQREALEREERLELRHRWSGGNPA